MLERLRLPAKIATGFLVAWFFSLPITVNALGFGNINMKSALNQPLVAEIELLSATPDDIKVLEVKLASKEAFMRAGVDRSVLLSRIKFNVVKRGGKYYINLRTQESIREPFLNFLLEMNWKSGRMLREYTVLLDPPDRVQPQQQVAKAPETAPAETFVAPAPSPLAPEPAPEPVPAPAPIAAPEPIPTPAPAPIAAADAPFLDTPAPAEQADGGLFPQVALDESPQVPAQGPDSVALIEPEPIASPEPIAAPEPIGAPEPVEMVEDPTELIPQPSKAVIPDEPAFDEQEDGLFPQIPLQAYSESAEQMADDSELAAPELVSADGELVPEPYEPVGELDYGITQKGDNAWNIASKLKPSEQISVYQVMMALQQSNPGAFIDGNIHRLKEGQVMRIDDASLLTAMSKEQASEQYQAQTQVWEEYVASVGGEIPRQAIVAGEDMDALTATGEPSGELTLDTPQGDDLSTGTGGDVTGTASSEDTALLREQIRQARSEASTERNKNADLAQRLEQLEQELKRLENLVTVKDTDLAALQSRLDELNAQSAAGGSQTIEPVQPTDIAQQEPEPLPEPVVTEPEPAPLEPAEPVAIEPEPIEPIEPEPIEPIEPVEPSPLEAPSVDEPDQPAPVPATQASDGGIMGTIMGVITGIFAGGTLLYIIGGVVGLVILALLVMIIIRRRKGVNFQESILTGASKDEPDSVIAADATPSQNSSLMGGESSFLSDFAISGVSAIQAEDSEVDPLTEADVFMAYGRYEAAEERLQEAINQDPGRGELRVKLLELFNTTKNKAGFESSAEEFYATLGDGASSDPLWQKVVAMGSEIAPGNPMFSGEGMPDMSSLDVPSEAPSADDSEVMDIGLDTGVFSSSELNGSGAGEDSGVDAYTGGGDLDFSLDENTGETTGGDQGLDFSLDADESSSEIPMPTADDLNFDLDSSSDESTQTALSPEAATESGLDFSLDGDTKSDEAAADLDFNMDLGGDDDPTATDIKLDITSSDAATGTTSGLDFDLNTEDESDVSSAGMDMNLDAGDAIDLDMPTGADEVGTKLDLARAYIDMGDPDGARSILDEVIDEGDDGQKQEAEQLMAQIG